MSITAADVKALGSEFSGLSNSFLETYIEIAEELIDQDAWGCTYKKALSLMSAHLVTLGMRGGGAGGPVTSERVADLSISYGTLAGTEDIQELAATAYGVMLAQLRRAKFFTAFCV